MIDPCFLENMKFCKKIVSIENRRNPEEKRSKGLTLLLMLKGAKSPGELTERSHTHRVLEL